MEKYTDFMLDLETLGTSSNAAVIQIGMVGFNPATGEVSQPFKISLVAHPKSTIDDSTVRWWMGQSDEARKSVFDVQSFDAEVALPLVSKFIIDNAADPERFVVWSKPSTFDIVILENLYKHTDRFCPWKHWNTRCLRTLIANANLGKSNEIVPTIPHDAGYDAEAQARTALKCFKILEEY